MNDKFLFSLFLLFCLLASAIFASDATSKTWTLRDCLIYGITSHPLIKVSESSVNVKNSLVEQSKSAINTKLNFRGGWNHHRDEHIRTSGLGSIKDYSTDSTGETISASKLIIDSGAVSSNIQSAKKIVLSAKMDKKAEIIAIAANIKEAKSSLKPYLTANANYNWSGTISPLNRTWNAGISLNCSLFDGKLTHARIKTAKWQLKGSKATYENAKLDISSEVENAVTNYNDASERFEVTKVLVKQAKETMELAEGRYDARLGSPIEITDAKRIPWPKRFKHNPCSTRYCCHFKRMPLC